MRQGSVVIEPLENRQLLAAVTITEATHAGGSQLQIQGSGADDRIVVNKTTAGYVITAQNGFRATYNGRYKSIVIRSGRGGGQGGRRRSGQDPHRDSTAARGRTP
jgi:hypothetical protein